MSDQSLEGVQVFGIDDSGAGPRVITGTLHAFGSGYEVWWDGGGLNTRWPTGHVGLSPDEAWAKHRADPRVDTRRRIRLEIVQ